MRERKKGKLSFGQLMLVVPAIVAVLFITGCIGLLLTVSKESEVHRNRELLNDLRLGMTQEEVLEHMGPAWRTEAFLKDEKAHVVLYYATQRIPDGATTDEEMTPLVIREGILIGWGRRFFSDLRVELRVESED